MADTANGDYHHEQASRQASKGRLYSSNGGLDAEKADEEKRPGWNGDDTGGRVFRYLLGDAKGYDQMSRADKLSLFKNELLLGLIICFAQIPESVAFGFLANVQPSVAIHSAWIVGLICSAFGGRPAMVNGATGAFAAIIGTFIAAADKNSESGEGVERLFVSVMLAGGLMLLVAGLRLSRLIVLVPSTVMIGFCNGLAIVIGMAQLHPFGYECKEVNDECPVKDDKHHWRGGGELGWMIAVMIISMLIMEFIPRLPWRYAKVVPSSLVSIVVAIIIEFAIIRQTGQRTNTIGDIAPFDSETAFPLPFFADNVRYEVDSPVVSKNLSNSTINSNTTQSTPLGPLRYDLSKLSGLSGSEVWSIILNGILLAAVGVIESLMTMEVVKQVYQNRGRSQPNRGRHGCCKHRVRIFRRNGWQCNDRSVDDKLSEWRQGTTGAAGDSAGDNDHGDGRLSSVELHPGVGAGRHYACRRVAHVQVVFAADGRLVLPAGAHPRSLRSPLQSEPPRRPGDCWRDRHHYSHQSRLRRRLRHRAHCNHILLSERADDDRDLGHAR